MAIPLPTSPLKRLEPLPEVETDGACLILRRVEINGKPHDIRVWRCTEEREPISAEGEVLRETIRKTQEVAKEIFGKYVAVGKKIYYEEGKCCEEDGSDLQGDVVRLMTDLHHSYFKEIRTTWSRAGESLSIVPRKIAIAASIPKAPKEEDDEKSAAPIAPIEPAPKEPFLQGVTLKNLVAYSKKPKKGDKLEKVYEVYQRVIRNPKVSGEEEEALKEWLHRFYLEFYVDAQERKPQWDRIKPAFEKAHITTFDDWCKYTAAFMTLKDIALPDGVSFRALANELQSR